MRMRFGDFVLDVDRRQLLRGSAPVHLSPKAFDLLTTLIEARPKALSKEELLDKAWRGTFVTENNVATVIADIRSALEDDPRRARFVRTVHGFGYAFDGMVLIDDEPTAATGTPMRPRVVWEGREIPLQVGENIIGREGTGVVALDSPTVSRRHARMLVGADRVTLEDLGSKNGTYLRDRLLDGVVALADGDEIRFGSIVVLFRSVGPAGATQTAESRG